MCRWWRGRVGSIGSGGGDNGGCGGNNGGRSRGGRPSASVTLVLTSQLTPRQQERGRGREGERREGVVTVPPPFILILVRKYKKKGT